MNRATLLVFLVMLLSAISIAGPASTQQNPLLGGQPSASPDDLASRSAVDNGLLHRLKGNVVMAQAYFTRQIDRQLVAIRDGHGVPAIIGGLVVAFLYGVFHALGPGHGKTVVVGYFLGHGGSLRRGLAMASWISLSHTTGAIVIVGIAHFIFFHSLLTPVEENWWLKLASYGAILAIGLVMLARAIAGKAHLHNHGDGHCHKTGHHLRGRSEQQLLAVAAGFMPCSGAILICFLPSAMACSGSGSL